MQEADIMRLLARAATALGGRLFRQNTGTAWTSNKTMTTKLERKVTMFPGDVLLRQARPFHAGFKGWSDLGGWMPVVITPEMVGSTVAVYAQVEVKKDTKASDDQRRWVDAVNRAGGLAGVARNEEEMKAFLLDVSRFYREQV